MKTITIVVEVEHGIATITDVAAPSGLVVRAIVRDYDTDGGYPEDADQAGRPCFESVTEYRALPDQPGSCRY